MNEIINSYYKNDAKKLHNMVDKILIKLKFRNIYNEDFYSLANEIFVDVINRYDKKKSFDGFLYSCLMNKFKSEMTRRNREKRKADRNSISIDTPIGDDENCTLSDIIAGKQSVESDFFEENKDSFSSKMQEYLGRLSPLQQDVLHLISIGFMQNEIMEELKLSKKQFEDCYNAIHSYRNIEILM